MRPADRLLLAFYLYGPSTYQEMSEYLGWLRSRLSIANQINIAKSYLFWTPERTGVRGVTRRFKITEDGIAHLVKLNLKPLRTP